MNFLFDTSVLLAGLVEAHPAYAEAFRWLEQVGQGEHKGFVGTHSLAELYNKLTRVPISRPVPPQEALEMLTVNVVDQLQLVSLSSKGYQTVPGHLAGRQFTGGIVYDALIVYADIKADADRIITLNPRHFRRIYPEVADRVVDPTEDPPVEKSG